ncbi:MAG: Gx transporter family protein [bacterium]|nr:Gx transporter family protein [bacterium]
MSRTQKLAKVSVLVAMATTLHTLESACLPPVFPGARIGLANSITLIAIILFSTKAGVVVVIARGILTTMLRGTIVGFILGTSGGVVAAIAMGLVYKIGRRLFSLVGISIIGAVANSLTQIIVAYYVLIKHPGCFYFVPVFLLFSLITGFFNGVVVSYLDKHLKFVKE